MSQTQTHSILTALLDAMTTVQRRLPAGPARERLLGAIEAEVLPLLADLPARQDIGEAIAARGRRALLEPYLEAHPRVAVLFQQTDTQKSKEWLAHAEPGFLTWVDEIMPARMFADEHLFAEAIRRDEPELFATLMARHGPLQPFEDIEDVHAMNAIQNTGPTLAREIATRLTAAVGAVTPTIDGLTSGLFFDDDLKVVAVLARAGLDLRNAMPMRDSGHPPELQALIDRTGSAHGRLGLREEEPDLVALLARPAGGTFYGLQACDGEIRIGGEEDPE